MQIPPSTSLLQALSGGASTANATSPNRVAIRKQAEAAEKARAVFAQLKTPATASPAASAGAPAAPAGAPAIPSTQPRRPMPRGSIINILV